MSDDQRFTDTNPPLGKVIRKWCLTKLDNGDIAVEAEGMQILYVAESMQAALEWLSKQFKSGELGP